MNRNKREPPAAHASNPRVFTLGHSNRTLGEFLDILKSYKLKLIVDVRAVPGSRHNPQFGMSRLSKSLAREGIEYIHVSGLGGRRKPEKHSRNAAWRNPSFRGFADYMQTPEFEKNLRFIMSKSRRKRLVLMCAEAVPWRCHRSLIADALLAHGLKVEEIMSAKYHRPHRLTPFARRRGERVTYPEA